MRVDFEVRNYPLIICFLRYFAVIAPQALQLGESFRVIVKAQDYDEPTDLIISIVGVTDGGASYENNHNVRLKNDRSQFVVFDIKNQEIGNYWLQAKSVGGRNFTHKLNLHLTTKKYSVFVQTDKAIYKPGDKVQFRVLVLDSETRPYIPKKIEIFITDGAQNRIKEFNKASFIKGISQNELQLSDEPILGIWTIHVKVNGDGGTDKTFEVAEYVLPKFEVIIATKRNVRIDEKILVGFAAKYTYGKQVTSGTARVTAELADYWWNEDNQAKLTIEQELSDTTNVVEFNIVKELNMIGMWEERDVKITVNFKDGLTGAEQIATTLVTIHRQAYKVELIGNHDGFKPGLPFAVSAIVTDLEGIPVMNSTDPVVFVKTYTYNVLETDLDTNAKSTTFRPFFFWRPPPYVIKTVIVEQPLINGEAKLSLEITDNVTSITITGVYRGVMGYFMSDSLASESKQYIEVKVATKRF